MNRSMNGTISLSNCEQLLFHQILLNNIFMSKLHEYARMKKHMTYKKCIFWNTSLSLWAKNKNNFALQTARKNPDDNVKKLYYAFWKIPKWIKMYDFPIINSFCFHSCQFLRVKKTTSKKKKSSYFWLILLSTVFGWCT